MIKRFLDRPRTAWICVVAVPLLMVALDPLVFRNVFGAGEPIYAVFKPFSYVAIGLGASAMAVFLLTGRAPALLAGMFAGGALFAIALGLLLLPFSAMGVLMFGLGLLGLTPFLTGATLARWSYTVFHQAPARGRALAFGLGLVIFLGSAGGAQLGATRAMRVASAEMMTSDEGRDEAIRRLRPWRWLVRLDELVTLWVVEQDEVRKSRVADAFVQLTGQDIQSRYREMNNSD